MINKISKKTKRIDCKKKLKAKRELHFFLPPDTFRFVSSLESEKEIWDRLNELQLGYEDLKHSIQTILPSKFDLFKQKYDETLDQAINQFNHLLSRMLKHGLKREPIKHKITFMNGFKSKWNSIISTVKAHEQFQNYILARMVAILRSHET